MCDIRLVHKLDLFEDYIRLETTNIEFSPMASNIEPCLYRFHTHRPKREDYCSAK